jgi:hypothetical protein
MLLSRADITRYVKNLILGLKALRRYCLEEIRYDALARETWAAADCLLNYQPEAQKYLLKCLDWLCSSPEEQNISRTYYLPVFAALRAAIDKDQEHHIKKELALLNHLLTSSLN